MRKSILLSIGFLICFAFPADAKKKKAVFVIVDGIPADVIERIDTPMLDEISTAGGYTRAYMGGEVKGSTQTPTISAVCYNSLLTSTWVNKHNVWGNGIENPNYNYWNIFRIAGNQPFDVKTAIFSSWEDNRTKLIGEGLPEAGSIYIDKVLDGLENDKERFPAEPHDLHIFKIDEEVSKGAAACIREQGPDITWVYLWFMDCVGHEFGDGEEFDKYTKLTDRQIGRIWEAVKEREKSHNEEWMVVITTDHGRSAKDGKGHGGQSDRERTIWISTNQKPNRYFELQQPGIVDIVPSICGYMGYVIPEDLSFEQEGVSFIEKIDFSNLKAAKDGERIELTWESYNNSPLNIYVSTTNNFKDGGTDTWTHVGKVSAKEKRFTYEIKDGKSSFYKFSVRGRHNNMPAWVVIDEQ